MKDSSQSKNFKFGNVSLKQINTFFEVISETLLQDKAFIKKKYIKDALHFEDVLYFLDKIKLIRIKEAKIYLSKGLKSRLQSAIKRNETEELIQKLIVKNFIARSNTFSKQINEFLSHFTISENYGQFRPVAKQRIQYSDLRNLLLDLEYISFDRATNTYYILTDNFKILLDNERAKEISPEIFRENIEKQADLGSAAEEAIYEYEKERLSAHPDLAKNIEHVSRVNVMAGYDIKSFELKTGKYIKLTPRYIEVKAVSPSDYRFNWTGNEIRKAKMYQDRYYIYLLPVLGNKKFDVDALMIISNPYKNIYSNEKCWNRYEEVLAFSVAR